MSYAYTAPWRHQGTVNAGFGTTWTEEAAHSRAYRRAPAVAELRSALQGEELPTTDEPETLGAGRLEVKS